MTASSISSPSTSAMVNVASALPAPGDSTKAPCPHHPPARREEGKQTTANKAYSRMLGSATAGACELMLFHPVDTITKRLMSTKTKYIQPGQTAHNLNQIIFKQKANAGILQKGMSLFPGLGFAAGYKVLQRTYKFGGQPFVNDQINTTAGGWFKSTFGEKTGRTLMQATAGSLIGIGEVLLLPLDVLKIKAQTNPEAFGNNKGFGAIRLLWSEGRALYAGAGATMLRNAPGSFALFGGAELVYQYGFHVKDRRDAKVYQHLTASVIGSIGSIAVSAPLDTIKTRIQNQNFGSTQGGMSVFRELIKNEGPTALWKGLTPKILMVGPKLVFSMTIANYLISALTIKS